MASFGSPAVSSETRGFANRTRDRGALFRNPRFTNNRRPSKARFVPHSGDCSRRPSVRLLSTPSAGDGGCRLTAPIPARCSVHETRHPALGGSNATPAPRPVGRRLAPQSLEESWLKSRRQRCLELDAVRRLAGTIEGGMVCCQLHRTLVEDRAHARDAPQRRGEDVTSTGKRRPLGAEPGRKTKPPSHGREGGLCGSRCTTYFFPPV
jgi:hypothetical protein